ncbi:MAG: penicillin-binding protein [Erysipelotrichaceae bacterium]|nr:penicillin-binding protein [Erysipelotrichaceae bacterium]
MLLANVLLLDVKGKNFFADVDFRQQEGVSIVNRTVRAERGDIRDADGNLIAMDKRVYKIIFILSSTHKKTVTVDGVKKSVSDYVEDPAVTAEKVAEILGADEQYIYSRLTMKDRYQVEIGTAGTNIDSETKKRIDDLNLPGISWESSTRRYYPMGSFASHLIGYVNSDASESNGGMAGLSGIEKTLNTELSGQDGREQYYSDVRNNMISGGEIEKVNAADGYDVTLTLNNTIQRGVDVMLQNIMDIDRSVDKAWAIVMNAKTGAIYGYDSYPTFDPNTMEVIDYNDYCASLPYEPGSTMKAITYAAAIDLGRFNKNAQFNANNYYVGTDAKGNLKRSERGKSSLVIHNSGNSQYGMTTYERAFINSYNVGTVTLLEEQIGKKNWEYYVDAFGFFKPVDVYGISEGSNYGRYDFSNVFSLACSSFGSGMSCNALQMIQAYTAFCNQGTMIRPYIIQSVTDTLTGETVFEGGREEVGTPIKASTASQILELMYQVCHSGYHVSAHTLEIPGITIGCKTGTAPVVNEQGVYTYDDVIHSVMITMPADDPQVLVYVAYQDNKDRQRNFKFVRTLLQQTIDELNLMSGGEEAKADEKKEIYVMDNLKNHTVAHAESILRNYDVDVITIGSGDTVIRQYPIEDSRIISGQRVLLLTSLEGIRMPDMKGWSRSEVMAFWDLTGIGIKTEGYGFVTSQSVAPGEQIDKSVIINLKFEE